MLKLDNNLLDELGLSALPDDQKKAMLQHIYETLELRVGTNLANQMTDQQLEEFEKFIDDGGDANQAQALQWLETNLPNYKQVVNEVFEALKGEIKQMAPQLVAASQQPAQMPPQQPQAAMPPADPYAAQPASQGAMPPQTDPYATSPQQTPAGQYAQPPVPPQPAPAAPADYYQPQAQPQGPQPMQQPQTSPAPQQDAQTYQFPQQQPSVGSGVPQPADPTAQQPPQYPGQQAA